MQDQGNMFILDLNAELKKKIRGKNTKNQNKRLKSLEEKRKRQKDHNIKVAAPFKRKQQRILKELKGKRGAEAKRKREQAKKNLKSPPQRYKKYDLSLIDKQARRTSDNKIYYTVSDGFGKDYQIKAKDITSRKNLALYILNRYRKDVEAEIPRIKKTSEFKKYSKSKQKRILYGLKKLITKIDFNIQLVEKGIKKYEQAGEELKETDPPILIDFTNGHLIIQG